MTLPFGRRRREMKLAAYHDGELSPKERARVQQGLGRTRGRGWGRDGDEARFLEETGILGQAIRESWCDGPPAPSADRIMAAIRPELVRIDAERAAGGLWQRFVVRTGLELKPALAVAAVSALAVLLLAPGPRGASREVQHLAALPTGPDFVGSLDSPGTVYDVAEGESPLMVFEAGDGSPVIWMLEDAPIDDLSFGIEDEGWV